MAGERVQRRLAAILAADVVGYSGLMEADEAGTLARLKTLRAELIDPKIADHGGRIVKTMGDGVLVEFPSAVAAVESALSIQRATADHEANQSDQNRLQFRVGINLGDVIIEGDDIHGDGVNVAARLEGLCEPGGILVSSTVHDHVEGKLAAQFEDLGEKTVKNIRRPVKVYSVRVRPLGAAKVSDLGEPLPGADRPSIAVLPFDNLSGDPEQEYFSDGMAEDLITDLSKLSNIFVAARNSSFAFKGRMPDVREVAEKLGVKYVLEGSVRKMGDRLRINAQLIGAADGGHIWAERFDGAISEVFEFQDRIRDEILAALEIKLTNVAGDAAERRQTRNVEAYDYYLNGRQHYYQYTPEAYAEAFRCFEKAVEIDPTFADAYSYLASCHTATFVFRWLDIDEGLVQALAAAEKAAALDPDSALAHSRLGWVYTWQRRYEEAERAFQRAEALEPELVEALVYHGIALAYAGNPGRGLELTKMALRLDPFAPLTDFHLGVEFLLLGRLDDAVAKLEMARERTPKQINMRLQLASAYVDSERMDEARREIEDVLEFVPDYTLALADRIFPYRLEDVRRHFLDNLQKAGLPDHVTVQESARSFPDKPSIAVLPFDNMSGDAEQEYFADGLAEDVITTLSKIAKLSVIARNSTFAYKGTAMDVRQIAENLDVRYVLEGSVRSGGNRLRVSAQLIDATDGRHIWAERYDRVAEDVFEIQDEITKEIVTALRVQLSDGEEALVWNRGTKNVEAWRCATEATEAFLHFLPDDITRARELSRRAVDLDPDYAHAWAVNASCDCYMARIGPADEVEALIDRAERSLSRALSLDDTVSWVHFGYSALLGHRREFDAAINSARKAVALQPGNAEIRAGLGYALVHAGRPEEALQTLQDALRLNPYAHGWYRILMARAHDMLGDTERALQESQKAAPDIPFAAHLNIASLQARKNNMADARAALAEALRRNPQFTLASVERYLNNDNADYVESIKQGLRKAGLPE
jgi:adenylate cyclase